MEAPLYPPAARFEQPRMIIKPFSTKDTPIADLRSNPAAWAIVNKEIPEMEMLYGGPLNVHMTNFSIQSLLQFGAAWSDILPRIDAQLKALGEAR